MTAIRQPTLQAILILAAVFAAVRLQFLQDDAFISFRYAENFANGLGLVWQPGDAVQGYTNFLWTLTLGVVHWLGAPLEGAAITLGLSYFAGALILFAALARRLFPGGWLATALLALLASNYSYLCYATGGLETMQQSFWMLAAALLCHLCLTTGSARGEIGLSLVFAVLMLTRLDSALIIVVLTSAILWQRRAEGTRAVALSFARLSLPALAIFGAYGAWAVATYGSLLPNTFHIKTGDAAADRIEAGALFAWTFYHRYLLHLPVLAAIAIVLIKDRRAMPLALAAYAMVWTSYVVWTGGDFMEFRFFVTLTPLLILLMGLAWCALPIRRMVPLGLAAGGILAGASVHHGLTFPPHFRDIESIRRLDANLYQPGSDWVGIGQRLAAVFPQGYDGPVIGISPAGAIPYYARLPALDLLGLNHDDVAQDAIVHLGRPGHRLTASPATMARYGVNLLISHPATHTDAAKDQRLICAVFWKTAYAERLPPAEALTAPLVAMDMDGTFALAMLVLQPHPAIDAALATGDLVALPFTLADCAYPEPQ